MEVLTKDEGLKFLIQKPMVMGRMSRRATLLSEYDISLVTPAAVKSQALVDLLTICLGEKEEDVRDDVPRDIENVNAYEDSPE